MKENKESHNEAHSVQMKVESLEALIREQISLMQYQLEMISNYREAAAFKPEAKKQASTRPKGKTGPKGDVMLASLPPEAGARLGKDAEGNAAWFAPNPEKDGVYVQL